MAYAISACRSEPFKPRRALKKRQNNKTVIQSHFIDSSIKSDYRKNRRLTFSTPDFTYDKLIERLCFLFPELKEVNYSLCCKDETGYRYPILCQKDLDGINFNSDQENRLFVIINNDFKDYNPDDSGRCQYFCDHCGYALKRYRYKCLECPNYEICLVCHMKKIHTNIHKMQYKIPVMDYNVLKCGKNIGEGYYSDVYLATFQNKGLVVVKKPKPERFTAENYKAEVKNLKNVGIHDNVVRMLGYTEKPQPMAIIMEYDTLKLDGKDCPSLNFYLLYWRQKLEQKKGKLDTRELDSFALQISRAMDHLESKKIIHGDVAARNVLINREKTLKICDFGLAKGEDYQGPEKYQSRWSAPEVVTSKTFSHKSDVWSFGVALWELATLGGEPLHEIKSYKQVNAYVGKGGCLSNPGNISKGLFDVMEKCWAKNPDERPAFKDVLQKLNDFKWLSPPYIPFERMDQNFKLPPVYKPEFLKFEKFFLNA